MEPRVTSSPLSRLLWMMTAVMDDIDHFEPFRHKRGYHSNCFLIFEGGDLDAL